MNNINVIKINKKSILNIENINIPTKIPLSKMLKRNNFIIPSLTEQNGNYYIIQNNSTDFLQFYISDVDSSLHNLYFNDIVTIFSGPYVSLSLAKQQYDLLLDIMFDQFKQYNLSYHFIADQENKVNILTS